MGGVVTDVKYIEKTFLGEFGKQLALVAGQADEAHQALLLEFKRSVDDLLRRPLGKIAQQKYIGVFQAGSLETLDEKMLGEPGVVGISEHANHQLVTLAGCCNVADGRAHRTGAAPDEGAPGEVVAPPLEGLFVCGGRSAKAR